MTTDAVYLNEFQSVYPKNRFNQNRINEWISLIHQKAEEIKNSETRFSASTIEKLFRKYSVKESQIQQRYFECSDVTKDATNGLELEKLEIYFIGNEFPQGANSTERAIFFSDRSLEVFEKIYTENLIFKRPQHIIHVTCTGYTAPSAAQHFVSKRNWNDSTEVTHAYHMGCYASLPAIRIAASLAATRNNRVDIVHNEMCGLHMNVQSHSPEQIIIQTLFADGNIKYSVTKEKSPSGENLKVTTLREKILPLSDQDMKWLSSPWGMEMRLSREVPAKIRSKIEEFYQSLLPIDWFKTVSNNKPIFAIHPGGPKIIQSIQEVLKLDKHQIEDSEKILLERGNMSSATLPHIWETIIQKRYPVGTPVVSFAFGPGLTIFGALFEVC